MMMSQDLLKRAVKTLEKLYLIKSLKRLPEKRRKKRMSVGNVYRRNKPW